MASQASSEHTAAIPRLPGLGTSWYRHGGRYWTRRVLGAACLSLFMAFLGYVSLELYGKCLTAVPAHLRPACDAAEILLACAGTVWGWISGRRRLRKERVEAAGPEEVRARIRYTRARAQNRGVFLLFLIASPILPAIVAYAAGALCAGLATREYPREIGARREVVAKGLPAYPHRPRDERIREK